MIQSRAMLATLSISQWTARKQDKKVSREVESSHGAHDAGKYNKLLVNKSLLEPLSKLAGQVREYHYFNTLAWADSGARLLPSQLFMDYVGKIRGFKEQFGKLVKQLQADYPSEVATARSRLGTMYDPADYPAAWELSDRFGITVEFMPVPDGKDFRVDVADEMQDELRTSVTQAVAARQADAVKATYTRVQEVVSKIQARLSVHDAVFKDSLIENARDLCIVLSALNITDDPKIVEVQEAIERHLLVDPESLRRDSVYRRRVADKAQGILAMLP